MEELKKRLEKFEGNITPSKNDVEKLTNEFTDLAPYFLYGGYIKVREDYKVYIQTVEFYFHSEEEQGVHDPIVYHRNGRYLDITPYFPPMTLNAHNSGLDITFESETGHYRASALIRAYKIMDSKGRYYLWNKDKKMFVYDDGTNCNTQSTYLYDFLNGFSLGNNSGIEWIDSPIKTKKIDRGTRCNVFQSESEWKYIPIKREKCKREWSFTRTDEV